MIYIAKKKIYYSFTILKRKKIDQRKMFYLLPISSVAISKLQFFSVYQKIIRYQIRSILSCFFCTFADTFLRKKKYNNKINRNINFFLFFYFTNKIFIFVFFIYLFKKIQNCLKDLFRLKYKFTFLRNSINNYDLYPRIFLLYLRNLNKIFYV